MGNGATKAFACLLLLLLLLLGCGVMTMARAQEPGNQQCVMLDRIDLDDGGILDEQRRARLFAEYLGRCIDASLLRRMLAALAQSYIELGYITTVPYLTEQNVADGQLDIRVVPGRVEAIVDKDSGRTNARINTAFAFQRGELLNLRDLETALEAMNRPPSIVARFDIKPGSRPGTSIVEVSTQNASPWHLKLGVTGRRQADREETFLTAEGAVDNPLNINDILSFRLNNNQVQQEGQSSRAGDINYSFPISRYLLEFNASHFTYRQGVQGVNVTYLADGRTKGLRAKLSRMLWRDQSQTLRGGLSVYRKDSRNYLANQLIEVSSYKTTLLQLDVVHQWLHARGDLTTTYSYYQGMDWFGARDDSFYDAQTGTPGQARLQFKKHSLNVFFKYRFSAAAYQWSTRAHRQYTRDVLFDNDKFSVGGDYTVRGYPDGSLYGNNAWYINNELTRSWEIDASASVLHTITLFGGLDYGHVRCEKDNPLSCGDLFGAALGVRSHGQRLMSSLTLAWPLKKITAQFRRRPTLRLDMVWGF